MNRRHLVGKRDSRGHFTTSFSGNVVVTEKGCRFYYFAILTSFNKITLLTFLVTKKENETNPNPWISLYLKRNHCCCCQF